MEWENAHETAALELAAEDLYGLWEVVWRLRQIHPDASDLDLHDWARRAIQQLSREGFIDIFQMDLPASHRVPLTQEQVTRILALPDIWEPPSEQTHEYRMGATDQGKTEYRDRTKNGGFVA